jgi:hypothetical protein
MCREQPESINHMFSNPPYIFFVLYGGEVGESFSIFGHVSRATGVHQPYVLQSSTFIYIE